MALSRRDFIAATALGSAGLTLSTRELSARAAARGQAAAGGVAKRPIIVSAANGYQHLDPGFEILRNGGDTLEAVLRVVRGPEDDPNDTSVGLGGLPNEEGVVELDASCMHGPTRRAGAVGAVRNIQNVSLLAREVMEHSGHVMLAGEGAARFAVARGFKRVDLLTDHSRKVWLLWKESHADWWGPGLSGPNWKEHLRARGLHAEEWQKTIERLEVLAEEIGIEPARRSEAIHQVLFPPMGTIHCSAVDEKGEMSGCTTTSGLAWKLPGRLGDSPIIGAGCYTDQDVGSAGATGSGEENIRVAGAHTIVENMRKGMSPHDAGMDALQRIARNYDNDKDRLRYTDMTYYVLRKDGAYAGVSLWTGYNDGKPHRIAVHDGTRRLEQTVSLFQGLSEDWAPTPKLKD